jgi:hypothetical protein
MSTYASAKARKASRVQDSMNYAAYISAAHSGKRGGSGQKTAAEVEHERYMRSMGL